MWCASGVWVNNVSTNCMQETLLCIHPLIYLWSCGGQEAVQLQINALSWPHSGNVRGNISESARGGCFWTVWMVTGDGLPALCCAKKGIMLWPKEWKWTASIKTVSEMKFSKCVHTMQNSFNAFPLDLEKRKKTLWLLARSLAPLSNF